VKFRPYFIAPSIAVTRTQRAAMQHNTQFSTIRASAATDLWFFCSRARSTSVGIWAIFFTRNRFRLPASAVLSQCHVVLARPPADPDQVFKHRRN
jgi:hypothetical protein